MKDSPTSTQLVRGDSALFARFLAPEPGAKSLCVQLKDASQPPASAAAANAEVILIFAKDPPYRLLELPELPYSILALAYPWDKPAALATLLPRHRRCLVVSALGWRQGSWCDGPLAHITEDGQVASYLPRGGAGALRVPTLNPGARGVALVKALTSEGTDVEVTYRCMLGLIDSCLGTAGAQGHLQLTAEQFDLKAAVTLTLIRQARVQTRLYLRSQALDPGLSAPWRRLCQNLGVYTNRTSPVARTASLDHLSGLLAGANTAQLAAAINRLSDVLPGSLL